MDVQWFKAAQKKAGVTADDIARQMGRTRSNVSNIYSGQQRMSLDWAQAFAAVLNQPLDEVLRRAGVANEQTARELRPTGFGEGDAEPYRAALGENHRALERARTFGAAPAGIDVWVARSNALALNGIMPGDCLVVDTGRAERAAAGDIVVAQHYDHQTGGATTLLRRYEPPVLVAASLDPAERRVIVVDNRNVVIRGVVVASWRDMLAQITPGRGQTPERPELRSADF